MPHPAQVMNFLVKSGVKNSIGVSQLWFGQGFEAELCIPNTKICARVTGSRTSFLLRKKVHVQSGSVCALCFTIVSPVGCAGIRVREIDHEIKPKI